MLPPSAAKNKCHYSMESLSCKKQVLLLDGIPQLQRTSAITQWNPSTVKNKCYYSMESLSCKKQVLLLNGIAQLQRTSAITQWKIWVYFSIASNRVFLLIFSNMFYSENSDFTDSLSLIHNKMNR